MHAVLHLGSQLFLLRVDLVFNSMKLSKLYYSCTHRHLNDIGTERERRMGLQRDNAMQK